MDALDVSLYRELFREKVMWWGTMDPRLSDEKLATRLGVARTTVRDRLARWRASGFLQGYAIIPNPRLFGDRIAGSSLRVDDVRVKPRVIEAIGDVDGAFAALDHVGPWMALALIEDTQAGLARRRRLVQRITGVEEVLPCTTLNTPECTQVLSALDWRIVAALRAAPEASLGDLARDVGVSQKTLGRRYTALIRSRAVWYLPLIDFARAEGTVARLFAVCEADEGASAAIRAFRSLDNVLSIEDTRGVTGQKTVEAHVCLSSAADVEEVERRVLETAGVTSVESIFPRRGVVFLSWADDRLAATHAVLRTRSYGPAGG